MGLEFVNRTQQRVRRFLLVACEGKGERRARDGGTLEMLGLVNHHATAILSAT